MLYDRPARTDNAPPRYVRSAVGSISPPRELIDPTAANEMTARTTKVSIEARESGGPRHRGRDNAIGLSGAMEALRLGDLRSHTATAEIGCRVA